MLLLLLTLLASPPADARLAAKLKVLVVTGGHGFQAAPFFKMFDDDTAISYAAATQGKAAEAFERPDLYDFDAVVLYDSPSEITEAQKVGDKVIVAEATYQPIAEIPVVIAVKDHALTAGVAPFTRPREKELCPSARAVAGSRRRRAAGQLGLPVGTTTRSSRRSPDGTLAPRSKARWGKRPRAGKG